MEEAKQRSLITTMNVDRMTQFSDLPSCLVMDILLGLPLTTLLTCRCVCKEWTRLFQDPSFIKLHLAASPIHILNRSIWRKDRIFQFGQVMEDTTGDLEMKIVSLYTKVNMPFPTEYGGIYFYECFNSCNGLLCLVDGTSFVSPFAKSVCVCSPILGECVSFSTPARNYTCLQTLLALVFSAKNNQYKVLHGFITVEGGYGFEVYTLGGTRQWRSIDETLGCRPCNEMFYDEFNTFLHGSVHWIDDMARDFICCFDVDDEKFQRLPLPIRKPSLTNVMLGVLHGDLCALFFDRAKETDEVEIWSMKEYGVEESWTVMASLHASVVSLPSLVFSWNEEEILMYNYCRGLVSYDLKSKTLRRGEVKTVIFHDGVVAYKPSFVSLQDVAKGEEVMLARNIEVEEIIRDLNSTVDRQKVKFAGFIL